MTFGRRQQQLVWLTEKVVVERLGAQLSWLEFGGGFGVYPSEKVSLGRLNGRRNLL